MVSQIERCPEIAFSAHQKHWKSTQGNTLQKRTELTISLIFGLGTIVRLHVCSYHPGKMRHSRLHTSYHDNKFANTETLINIVCLGNSTMAGNMFSRLQNAENELSGTLNTNKHTWRFHQNFDEALVFDVPSIKSPWQNAQLSIVHTLHHDK